MHRLPLGHLTLRVSAEGYADHELTLELVAGAPGEARVVLEAETDR